MTRPAMKSDLLEEIGEGCLFLGSNGSGTDALKRDPVAIANMPSRKDRVDTAHLARLSGTDFVQWYGRKGDGSFWPIGRIMRLTEKGKALLHRKPPAAPAGQEIAAYHKPTPVPAWLWTGQKPDRWPKLLSGHFGIDTDAECRIEGDRLLVGDFDSGPVNVPAGHWLVLEHDEMFRALSPEEFDREFSLAVQP